MPPSLHAIQSPGLKLDVFSQFSEVLLEHFKVVFVLFCFQKIPFYITGKNDMWAGTLLLADM